MAGFFEFGPFDAADSFVVDLASHTVATGSNRA
jgi:hypothetical protein